MLHVTVGNACLLVLNTEDDGQTDSNDVEAKNKRRLEKKEQMARCMIRVYTTSGREEYSFKRYVHYFSLLPFLGIHLHSFFRNSSHVKPVNYRLSTLALHALELASLSLLIACAPWTVIANKIPPQVDILLD